MNFNQFVFRNTFRNKHLYLAYFLSTMFTVMTFFTFNVFAFHPSIAGNLQSSVQSGMNAAAGIVYVFSFFFVLYSMDIFLQSRKREFGLLLIQGMSPKQLRKMIFQENLIVGLLSTVAGIVVGVGFSQIILWLSKVTMNISFDFYFPVMAMAITLVSFIILFLLISVFIQFKIPKMNVQELLKSDAMGKGELKNSKIKTLLAVLLIGAGYAAALYAKGLEVIVAMVPVIVVVIIGTNLLFNQLTVGMVNLLKSNERRFWKKTNMLVFSDLAYRMKDNARSFFLVAVISTVAFAAIGSLTGFREMILGTYMENPIEFYYSSGAEGQTDITSQKAGIEKILNENNVAFEHFPISIVTYSAADGTDFSVIPQNQYNQLADFIGLEKADTSDQGVFLKEPLPGTEKAASPTTIQLTDGTALPLSEIKLGFNFMSLGNNPVVVSNAVFDRLAAGGSVRELAIWQPQADVATDDLMRASEALLTEYEVAGNSYMMQQTVEGYKPVLFVGLFIGIVFFISAGSFLYFRLYSDRDVDVKKFKMVYKIGMSRKEMQKVIYQQVGLLFFTPIIVAMVHGAVALKAMYAVFDRGMELTAVYVLGTFLLIQVVYYLVARKVYFKNVYQEVTDLKN